MNRHNCGNGVNWPMCVVCNGRIHLEGCTTKRRHALDCCATRHAKLYTQGQVRGVFDDSFLMWSPEHPTGVHLGQMSERERARYERN
jgi:hypothetical protein